MVLFLKGALRKAFMFAGFEISRFSYLRSLVLQNQHSIDFATYLRGHMELWGKEKRVQIVYAGAFDGTTSDELSDVISGSNCKVLFIEPQLQALDRLKMKFPPSGRFKYFAGILTDSLGEGYLYSIDPNSLNLFPGIDYTHSTTMLDVLEKHLKSVKPELEPGNHIKVTSVPKSTINDLLETFKIKHVELLYLDLEGLDAKILKNLDYSKWKPQIINFEHTHLFKRELVDIYLCLINHGYELAIHNPKSGNTSAYLKRN